MPVRIVTDSACDLPDAVVEELGIEIVPLTIRFGSEELVDREELSNQAFWQRLATATTLPETAAPSAGAFAAKFRTLSDAGAAPQLYFEIREGRKTVDPGAWLNANP